MRNEKVMTKEQIGVLMWVKALNDFKSPDCPNDTLNDKINKFKYESAGIDDDTFWNGIEKMCSMNILEGITGSEEETVYELTTNGKALMTALSAIKNLTDETIKKIVNGSIRVIDFVKEHDSEIIGFIKFAIMR